MAVVLDELFKDYLDFKYYEVSSVQKISEMVPRLSPTRTRKRSLEADLLELNIY